MTLTKRTKAGARQASPVVVPVHRLPVIGTISVPKTILQFRRLFFALGVLGGAALAALIFSAASPGVSSTDVFQFLSGENLPSLEFLGTLREYFETSSSDQDYGDFQPGARLAATGIRAKHPVVMIPGIVSTGLQVWNSAPALNRTEEADDDDSAASRPDTEDEEARGDVARQEATDRLLPNLPDRVRKQTVREEHQIDPDALSATEAANRLCAQKYFRKRMWGTVDQIKALLWSKDCWLAHMMLNERTGRDPANVKLRAAQGLDAADYLYPGFWVWARVIANLGSIGYDSGNMHLAAYDWRLSYNNLELRDLYFTRLRSTIELAHEAAVVGGSSLEDARVMIISHSMGSTITMHFLNWARANHGELWCSTYLAGWINIAGTLLGVPKALASMLSGEMRDTAQLNAAGSYMLEYFFSRRQRARLFRSWAGMASMFPFGGSRVWGDASTIAPDEPANVTIPSFGALIDVTTQDQNTSESFRLTATNVSAFISHHAGTGLKGSPYWADTYAYGIAETKKDLEEAKKDPTQWSNPLLTPLPTFDPSFRILCLYGTGLAAERKYFYVLGQTQDRRDDNNASPAGSGDELYIDHTRSDPETDTENGVQLSDGDGTVPLISLSYMCTHGWKKERYNPGGVPVVTRETRQTDGGKKPFGSVRGGPETADHVDILGNHGLIEDILRMVGGQGDDLEDRIFSKAQEIGDRVKLPEGLD
ncbi:hypothetical protein HKX48_005082 [Thoreauomyces humboldtii]|nr:hypothetical protein HKX48_005082 [Thoreauomyces humboldtii]